MRKSWDRPARSQVRSTAQELGSPGARFAVGSSVEPRGCGESTKRIRLLTGWLGKGAER